MSKIVTMTGETFTPPEETNEFLISTEYAGSMAEDVVEKFREFGLAEEFIPIVGEHILNLQLVAGTAQTSQLDVRKVAAGNDRRGKWQRQAILSIPQARKYEKAILNAAKSNRIEETLQTEVAPIIGLDGKVLDNGQRKRLLAKELAVDWLFFELCADALSSSIYMQQKFTRYVRDFNGQNASDRTELTISRKHLGANVHPELVEEDHLALRSGIAIEMLADDLVRRGVCDTREMAEYLKAKLIEFYPKPKGRTTLVPFNREQIHDRLSTVRPRKDERKGGLALGEVVFLAQLVDPKKS